MNIKFDELVKLVGLEAAGKVIHYLHARRFKLTDEQYSKIIEMNGQGFTAKKISYCLGLPVRKVSQVINRDK